VDDEVRILTALRRCLRREGYDIVTADSPLAAIRILQEEAVDMILSDLKMPGMEGTELLARAARRHPAAVRVLITGWADAVSAEDLESLGVKALILKPWDDEILKRTLRECLVSAS
jgi:response regulator RpfG family c-di-GMP phosphodiesterase